MRAGQKFAVPSRRDMEISYAESKRYQVIQNQNTKDQTPNSKIQSPKSKIQNSKLQNPKGKVQIQNPKSKLQDPKSKQPCLGPLQTKDKPIQNPNSARLRPEAMAMYQTKMYGRHHKLFQPKGPRLGSPHARLKLGTDFQWKVLLEAEPRFPAPCHGNRGSVSRETTDKVARQNAGPRSSTLRMRVPKESNKLHAAVVCCHSR